MSEPGPTDTCRGLCTQHSQDATCPFQVHTGHVPKRTTSRVMKPISTEFKELKVFNMFSAWSGIKQEIKSKKKIRKSPNVWKSSDVVLIPKSPRRQRRNHMEIRKYLEVTDKENMAYGNCGVLWKPRPEGSFKEHDRAHDTEHCVSSWNHTSGVSSGHFQCCPACVGYTGDCISDMLASDIFVIDGLTQYNWGKDPCWRLHGAETERNSV